MLRKLRKHIVALIALAVLNVVVFFPVLFLARILSPNDILLSYEPWRSHHQIGVQNWLLNDPATAYVTLAALFKNEKGAFHWNPNIASGVPGFGSSASALFSPFALLPTALLPLPWFYTGMIFLKLNVAFLFAYLWLREERVGKWGAALGAILIAAAGVYSVRWLWQSTNATALYPALLWLVRRAFNRKPNRIWFMTLLFVAYLLAGFPATMAYGVYLTVTYALFTAIRLRRIPPRNLMRGAVAAVLALLIAAPALVPFAQFLGRSGYLRARADASQKVFYPPSQLESFIRPERLGNPAMKTWTGDRALGPLNNYVESTVYVGLAGLILLPFALVNRRARSRWFWLVFALVITGCLFGVPVVSQAVAHLPGFKYSALTRMALLLPIPIGYLAAAGAAWILPRLRRISRGMLSPRALAGTMAALAAFDLGLFAGRFHPYLEPHVAQVPHADVIDFLRREPKPYRIAAFFDYLWPNTSELDQIEDVRSHFTSEEKYRQLLLRIDPTAWGSASTLIQFNSLKFNFADPLIGMLGVRYLIEHKSIDIIKWSIFAGTRPEGVNIGFFLLEPGPTAQRTIPVNAHPYYAIEIPMSVEKSTGPAGRLVASLVKENRVVFSRVFHEEDIAAIGRIYLPIQPFARAGEELQVHLSTAGMTVRLFQGQAPFGQAPLYYGRVTTPIVFEREFADGRLFRNVAEVPRFSVARHVRKMSEPEFLASKEIDFEQEAIITQPWNEALPDDAPADARVDVVSYRPGRQILETSSSRPFFLASSEKLTPELRVSIDGRDARGVEIHLLFTGIEVPAGRHTVVFTRRIGRGWWWPAAMASLLWVVIAVRRQ